jgi:hypothetical protein
MTDMEQHLREAFRAGEAAGRDAVVNDRGEFADTSDVLERNPTEDPENAFRRGLQQGAGEIYHALEKAGALPDQLRRRLRDFVYHDLFLFRYPRRRRKLGRHIVRDHPPRLVIDQRDVR